MEEKDVLTFTHREILEKLPKSWSDITLYHYVNKLIKVNIHDTDEDGGVFIPLENGIEVAATYLDLSPDILRKFPLETIKDINRQLNFLSGKPLPLEKTEYKWVTSVDDPTYDTFILYVKVTEQISKGDFSNFHLIIKAMCKDPITDIQMWNMPMDEVETGFFFLRRSLLKYLNSMIGSLKNKMIVNQTVIRMKALMRSKRI